MVRAYERLAACVMAAEQTPRRTRLHGGRAGFSGCGAMRHKPVGHVMPQYHGVRTRRVVWR